MNRFQVSIIAVVAICLLLTIILQLLLPSEADSLDITLRCDEGVAGTLSVSATPKNNAAKPIEKSFDVQLACLSKNARVTFDHFPTDVDIVFQYKNKQGQTAHLISKPVDNIQSDSVNGYYVVIGILNAPPFLANDTI